MKSNKTKNNCCEKCWLERVPFGVTTPCLTPDCPCHKEKGCCEACRTENLKRFPSGCTQMKMGCCHNPIKLITNECIPCKAESELDTEWAATIEKLSPHTCHKQTDSLAAKPVCDCAYGKSGINWEGLGELLRPHESTCAVIKENPAVKQGIENPSWSGFEARIEPKSKLEFEKENRPVKGSSPNLPHIEADSWEEELQFGIMEDYLMTASLERFAKDQVAHKADMRVRWELLKSFVKRVSEAAYERGFTLGMMKDSDYDFEAGKAQALDSLTEKVEGMKETNDIYLGEDYFRGYNAAIERVLAALEAMKKEV